MDPAELHRKLRRLEKLEVIVKSKGKVENGDREVIELNHLAESIPLISVEDLREYLAYIGGNHGTTASEKEEQRLYRILDAVRKRTSPSAYGEIASVIEREYRANSR